MVRRLLLVLALLSLAACGPVVQQAFTPPGAFTGPRLEPGAFVSFDGARLGLQQWTPEGGQQPWAVIVAVHGLDDYANAFHLAGPFWAKDGIATLAYDQRGFGRSPQRGVWGGDKLMTEDLRTMVALAHQRYPNAIVAVAGESLGGSVAVDAFASASPPAASRVVLISPGVWGWSTQPFYSNAALWLVAHVDGPVVINPPDFITDHIRASDNIDELRAMGRDPLELWGARADTLYGVVGMMQRASDRIGRIDAPVFYLAGAHDEIVPIPSHLRAAKGLKPTDRSAFYPNGWHLLIVDKEREVVYRDIEHFIREPDAPLPSGTSPIPGAGGR